MVLVRRIRRRGANIVVESHAEVLFAPTGDVGRWTNRFSHRILAATEAAAPTNKRPRWAHYGKPLKSTFKASTTYQPGRMRVYAAVGSTAPHAYYVDQGTGIYAGNSPYEAKILPPWQHGSASLYEATWRPGGPGTRRVRPVMIKGQKGQGFFAEGLKRGFQSMRMRSVQVPTDGRIGQILNTVPTGLTNFLGNTENNGAFKASLKEWREWRDAAWERGEGLGRGGGIGSRAHEKFMAGVIRERAKVRPKHGLPAKAEAALAAEFARQERERKLREAAERRRREQVEKARLAREKQSIAEKKRAEKERLEEEATRKRIAARKFKEARLEAYRYLHAIEGQYPDAVVQISKDKSMIRVHFTGPGGVAHNEYFLR